MGRRLKIQVQRVSFPLPDVVIVNDEHLGILILADHRVPDTAVEAVREIARLRAELHPERLSAAAYADEPPVCPSPSPTGRTAPLIPFQRQTPGSGGLPPMVSGGLDGVVPVLV